MKILLIILSLHGNTHQFAFATKYCEASMKTSVERIKSELQVDTLEAKCYTQSEWKRVKG